MTAKRILSVLLCAALLLCLCAARPLPVYADDAGEYTVECTQGNITLTLQPRRRMETLTVLVPVDMRQLMGKTQDAALVPSDKSFGNFTIRNLSGEAYRYEGVKVYYEAGNFQRLNSGVLAEVERRTGIPGLDDPDTWQGLTGGQTAQIDAVYREACQNYYSGTLGLPGAFNAENLKNNPAAMDAVLANHNFICHAKPLRTRGAGPLETDAEIQGIFETLFFNRCVRFYIGAGTTARAAETGSVPVALYENDSGPFDAAFSAGGSPVVVGADGLQLQYHTGLDMLTGNFAATANFSFAFELTFSRTELPPTPPTRPGGEDAGSGLVPGPGGDASLAPRRPGTFAPGAGGTSAGGQTAVRTPSPQSSAALPAGVPDDVALVEEEPDPLVDGPLGTPSRAGWSLVSLLVSLAGLLVSLVLLLTLLRKRRKDEEEEMGQDDVQYGQTQPQARQREDERRQRSRLLKLMAVVPGLLTGVLFLLLDNVRLPMVLWNYWTPLILLVFVVHLLFTIVSVLVKKRAEEEQQRDNAAP